MTDYIKTELAKYNLPDAAIAKLKADYLPLKVKSIDDMDNYLACKEAHQEVKKIRIAIENKRKELKASSLEFGRAVDAEAKRLTGGVQEVEDHLANQRRVVEDEKKRIQEEKERLEREEQEKLRREEEERLETQRKEQEEKERKILEEQEKIEAEKRQIEEEKQKIAIEKERVEREKQEAIEEKKRAEQEKKDQAEREKRHAEEVEKAKKEAAEKALQEQKEKEEAEKAEATRKKLLAPDKEKILAYAQNLGKIETPPTSTVEVATIIADARDRVAKVIDFLKQEADKL